MLIDIFVIQYVFVFFYSDVISVCKKFVNVLYGYACALFGATAVGIVVHINDWNSGQAVYYSLTSVA